VNEGVLPNGGSIQVKFLKPFAAIVHFPEDVMLNITVWSLEMRLVIRH
jgi:hypothetical protein